jgi:predicted transposase/invertase (TIGR01784 family)
MSPEGVGFEAELPGDRGGVDGKAVELDTRTAGPYIARMRPVFADPKTDIIFMKIFGEKAHKGLLIELLNALLELDEAHRIVDIQYLSPEQMPLRKSLKLSILGVKCTDAQGTRYVVEMQVIGVDGFQKRVVFNACKAYTTQLGVGDDYPRLNDVIAVTICDFLMWEGKDSEGWTVPLLSRWQMQEQHRGHKGLGEVQYVFLELPKYEGGSRPRGVVEKWAYFFTAASKLKKVPEALAQGPFAQALEVAQTSNLNEEEWTEYEREKMAEQDYRGGITLAETRAERRGLEKGLEKGEKLSLEKGEKLGLEKGEKLGLEKGLRNAIQDLCEILGVDLTDERRAQMEQMDLVQLGGLRSHLKETRTWPTNSPAGAFSWATLGHLTSSQPFASVPSHLLSRSALCFPA